MKREVKFDMLLAQAVLLLSALSLSTAAGLPPSHYAAVFKIYGALGENRIELARDSSPTVFFLPTQLARNQFVKCLIEAVKRVMVVAMSSNALGAPCCGCAFWFFFLFFLRHTYDVASLTTGISLGCN